MKIRVIKAILLFLFSDKRFDILASAESAYQNEQDNKSVPDGSPVDRMLSARASYVRRALGKSFLLVAGTVVFGWISGDFANQLCGPSGPFLNRMLQFVGIGILLWATLGKQGWAIQTFGGESLIERIDRWIYCTLYVFGSYLLVLSASWSAQ